MNIYEQLIDTFTPMVQNTFTTNEIKKWSTRNIIPTVLQLSRQTIVTTELIWV